MLRPETLLPNLECPPMNPLDLGVAVLGVVEPGQVVDGAGQARVLRAELFGQPEGGPKLLFGLGVVALHVGLEAGVHVVVPLPAPGIALLGGAAAPFHRRGEVLRHAAPLAVHEAEIGLGRGKALVGGAAIPLDRLGVVARHALPRGVHRTKAVLSLGNTLIGGAAVPLGRPGVVPLHTPTLRVYRGESGLGLGMPQLGGAAIPFGGLGVVPRHAAAAVIGDAELVLGRDVTLLGGAAVPSRRHGVVAQHALAQGECDAEEILGVGMALPGQRCPLPQGGLVIAAAVGGQSFVKARPRRRRQRRQRHQPHRSEGDADHGARLPVDGPTRINAGNATSCWREWQ